MCSDKTGKSETLNKDNDRYSIFRKDRPPEPPITCCMSGCDNCVWKEYAEQLIEYYKDGGEMIRKEIAEIDDPALKAFLQMELKSLL